ncbi:hypothetical protein ABPG72_016889 [Tetrahymena utriculariae]
MQTLNFIFNNTELKVYGSANEPLFVVNDICDIISIDNRSSLIKNIIKNQKFSPVNLTGLKYPIYKGKQLAVVNERGLYEIMFRSNSKLCEQFKDEICDWLKQQRLSQNLIKDEQIRNLEQLNQDLEQDKQNLQTELDEERVKQRIDFLKNNFNHRITYFFHPETQQLLYAISYDEKYRRQNTKKILNLLQDEGFDEE